MCKQWIGPRKQRLPYVNTAQIQASEHTSFGPSTREWSPEKRQIFVKTSKFRFTR
jgi:hypothetical protein